MFILDLKFTDMKSFTLLIIGLGLMFISSCGNPADKMKENTQEEVNEITIAETDLFNGVKIMEFLRNKIKFIQDANELFLKGVDAYKNKKDLDSANYYFVHSILKEPSAKAYYDLGNVLKDQGSYDKAHRAYDMAEQLDFEPFSNILYKRAATYALMDNEVKSAEYIEYALQAGFNNMDQLNKDKDFDLLRNNYKMTEAVKRGLRGMSDPDKLFWLQYKRQFPKAELPITLKWRISQQERYDADFISYDFEKYIAEMRDEKFSREVSRGFYYTANVFENDHIVALVYMTKDEYMDEASPVLYRLATYTQEGRLIDKKIIGGQEEYEDLIRQATISQGGIVDVVVYEPNYEKDPKEKGYWENPIISLTEKSKLQYHIGAYGKIDLVFEQEIDEKSSKVIELDVAQNHDE